jgi:hypothetical protein
MSKRANVLALAIIIVMVSAGAAQGLSGKNTIFSNDISDGAVRSSDIENGTIRGKDVKNNSLTAKDIDESTLDLGLMRGSQGHNGGQGPAGPKGDTGPAGPQGDPGQAGASGWEKVTNIKNFSFGDDPFIDLTATCPAGKKVTGGGYDFIYGADDQSDEGPEVHTNGPVGENAWRVVAGFHSPLSGFLNSRVEVYALCVNGS